MKMKTKEFKELIETLVQRGDVGVNSTTYFFNMLASLPYKSLFYSIGKKTIPTISSGLSTRS